MDIRAANNVIGTFGIRHNTETFWETIELLDEYYKKNMLSDTEKMAYYAIIGEMEEYYSK